MPGDQDRQALYGQLRERFLNDPEFRSALRADPSGTLEVALGNLTDEERQWTSEIDAILDQELVDYVRSGRFGFW